MTSKDSGTDGGNGSNEASATARRDVDGVAGALGVRIADGGFDAGFFEKVVAEVGVGVGVYDDSGRFTYVNEAYADLLDRPVEDVLGLPIWAVNPAVHEERFDRYWRSFDVGETRQTETTHRRSDGTEIPVETHTTAVESDGTRYHVGTIADVSERVEGWRELERQDERLEQFASVVSHDLRNPLNVAMGRLTLAREESDSAHLAPVEDSLERMESLIDDVLTLARESGRLTEPEPVSLREAVTTAWNATGDHEATLDVEGDLGTVQSKESRLCRVFENLFCNAIVHGPGSSDSDDDPVRIRVGLLDDHDGFYVEDDGRGIDPDDRDAVFEYGYSTGERGTGFGLAIVEQIAEAHGWRVTLTTSEEDGARFEFHGVDSA